MKVDRINIALTVNGEEYQFGVELPPGLILDPYGIRATGAGGKEFKLGKLGYALMRLLVQLDYATKIDTRLGHELYRTHSARGKRRKAAEYTALMSQTGRAGTTGA